MTEWRTIPGFSNYRVSRCGKIGSCFKRAGFGWERTDKVQRVLKPSENNRGARGVILTRDDGKKIHTRVSTLVLTAFVGPRPDGTECCHYDGDPRNNSASNLRWDTRLSNHKDRQRHHIEEYGPVIVAMRERYAAGEDVQGIADDFGYSASHTRNICNGKFHAGAGGPITKGRR